jgi:hypothetical protein
VPHYQFYFRSNLIASSSEGEKKESSERSEETFPRVVVSRRREKAQKGRKELKKFSFNLISHHQQRARRNADENHNYFISDADYCVGRRKRVGDWQRDVESSNAVTITAQKHHEPLPPLHCEWQASKHRRLSVQAVVANLRAVCLWGNGDRIDVGSHGSTLSRVEGFTGTGKKKFPL